MATRDNEWVREYRRALSDISGGGVPNEPDCRLTNFIPGPSYCQVESHSLGCPYGVPRKPSSFIWLWRLFGRTA